MSVDAAGYAIHETTVGYRRLQALIIGIVIIIIRSVFEDLRLGGCRCGLFATHFALDGLRVPPGGVGPVRLARTTKM